MTSAHEHVTKATVVEYIQDECQAFSGLPHPGGWLLEGFHDLGSEGLTYLTFVLLDLPHCDSADLLTAMSAVAICSEMVEPYKAKCESDPFKPWLQLHYVELAERPIVGYELRVVYS